MAYIVGQDEEQNQNPQAASAPLIGGASANVGTGTGGSPGATGAGKGGQGGFVNLQSYLSANNTDTGGANALSSTVGSEFGKEKTNITDNSTKYVQDAQKQVSDSSIDNNQADELIKKSALTYDYGGKAGDEYNQNVSKVRGALTNQYSGPKEYNYGLGAQTQEYGTALGDDKSFTGLMGNIYSQRAGQALSTGQRNLQSQLDVHNTALGDARKRLLGDYTGLQGFRDETVKKTTEQLGGLEQQYRTNQNALRDYLGNQQNSYDTKTAQAEADARAGYKQTFEGDYSGRGNVYRPVMSGGQLASGGGTENMADRGVWGDRQGTDLTWQQLQREQNLGAPESNDFWYGEMLRGNAASNLAPLRAIGERFTENRGALNNFYGAQDQKYANTADTEKRSFNAILDFLNSDAARKEQGFQVRK